MYFAYCFPYTLTKLTKLLESFRFNPGVKNILNETVLCKTLSGIDLPLLTVTSRVNSDDLHKIESRGLPQVASFKRIIVVMARVHPGESNSSFVMEGFLRFILGDSDEARDLRSRYIFKVIPMVNPDGVVAGNYRSSAGGSDLNRQYLNPHQSLHPQVCAIKQLIKSLRDLYGGSNKFEDCIHAVLDFHGHSKKKHFFVYGPHYQIHEENYFKMRLIPKLL